MTYKVDDRVLAPCPGDHGWYRVGTVGYVENDGGILVVFDNGIKGFFEKWELDLVQLFQLAIGMTCITGLWDIGESITRIESGRCFIRQRSGPGRWFSLSNLGALRIQINKQAPQVAKNNPRPRSDLTWGIILPDGSRKTLKRDFLG